MTGEGKSPPGRRVEPNAEIAQIGPHIGVAQVRSEDTFVFLELSGVLMLESRIRKKCRERDFGETQTDILTENRTIPIRMELRDVWIGEGRTWGIYSNLGTAEAHLASPFILSRQGETQPFPGP